MKYAVVNRLTGDEIIRMKYPSQCHKYIAKHLRGSPVFDIVEVENDEQTKLNA